MDIKVIRQILCISACTFFCFISLSSKSNNAVIQNQQLNLIQLSDLENNSRVSSRPNPLHLIFNKHKSKNKKITAAILAFPLPFGIVGLHRIYMGCAPFVPVVYIASLGGAFGILPLIDFFVILKEEDISKFNNSDQVFMWVE